MTRIWAKSIMVTAVAVAATQLISLLARAALGIPPDVTTSLMALCIPVLISMPISLYVFRQTEELHRAHSALLAANDALARKASRDIMTGLLNRESFFNHVEVLRVSPERGALLVIDVDHFKGINDRFGHPVGDDALVRVAWAIAGGLRKGDLVGRIGGEEFAAFLVGADRQEAMRIGQRIRSLVEDIEFCAGGGERVELTVSVGGIVASEQPGLGELVQEADGCLYAAKRGGRNRVIIESGLTIAA